MIVFEGSLPLTSGLAACRVVSMLQFHKHHTQLQKALFAAKFSILIISAFIYLSAESVRLALCRTYLCDTEYTPVV